jgi:hypothetical protein
MDINVYKSLKWRVFLKNGANLYLNMSLGFRVALWKGARVIEGKGDCFVFNYWKSQPTNKYTISQLMFKKHFTFTCILLPLVR